MMQEINYETELVERISDFLQKFMTSNNIDVITADECAEILAINNLLSNKVGPKPGFNFREILRQGRDKKIPLVVGASQERPNTKWYIKKAL